MGVSASISSFLDVGKWPPAAVSAVFGLCGILMGACLTAWLAARRERTQRQLAFIEKQLSEFYSPMVGIRAEIRALSELRLKLHIEAQAAWHDLAGSVQPGPEAQAFAAARFPQFGALIEHDNAKFQESLMPAYRKMLDVFREKLWLAEEETRGYYAELVEFVDVWERWLAGSLPPELIERTGHTEQKLHPFYNHLEALHLRLRGTIARGWPD